MHSHAKIGQKARTAAVTVGPRLNVDVDWPKIDTGPQIQIHELHKANKFACDDVRAAAMSRFLVPELRPGLKVEGAIAPGR